jgi:hypothetical protein
LPEWENRVPAGCGNYSKEERWLKNLLEWYLYPSTQVCNISGCDTYELSFTGLRKRNMGIADKGKSEAETENDR